MTTVPQSPTTDANAEPVRYTKPQLYKMTISKLADVLAKMAIVIPAEETFTKDQAIQAIIDKQTAELSVEETDIENDPAFQAAANAAAPVITAAMVADAGFPPAPGTQASIDAEFEKASAPVKPDTSLPVPPASAVAAQVALTDEQVTKVATDLLGHPIDETTTEDEMPAGFLEKLRGALGFLGLKFKMDKLEAEHSNRIGDLETKVASLTKHVEASATLHGSIAALPKLHELAAPGRIEDLPKIG